MTNTDNDATKAESLLCRIACQRRIAADCWGEEKALASQRNAAECDAANAVIELSRELNAALGRDLAQRLTAELASLTGWRPPRAIEA